MPFIARLFWLGVLLSCLAELVIADDGSLTEAGDELPPWASDNTLQLQLSADSTEYAVIPLTEKLALGNTRKKTSVSQDLRASGDSANPAPSPSQ